MSADRYKWGEPPWPRGAPSSSAAAAKAPDVVIVGGGLTGTSTAYHLGRRGVRSVMLEAGLIGDGASGRTGGIVLEGTAAGPMESADSCVPELQSLVSEEQIDCELLLPGCWEIEHRDDARMLPWTDEGRPVCIARTVSGGVVQPAALVRGIAVAAVRAGAAIREKTPVRRIAIKPAMAIELDGETIYPGRIVVAVNAWMSAMLPNIRRISTALTFACATEPLAQSVHDAIGLGEGFPFYTADLPYLWGRTIADGRIVFGSGLVYGDPSRLESIDVSVDHSRAALERIKSRVRALHPALRDVEFSAEWAGPIAFTADAVPILGPHPDEPRALIAGAYAGHGVAFSVHAGKLMAEAIAEGKPLPKWGAVAR